ncbi:hypothetical protein [Streptomyces exfoliatus]|uniref:hypothetical protein n=1 Tax=Streptomyces exfoliatus TaxID=1905 RepID=UPI0004653377|nr:hypothetical protein [Streptomyces exfoliatus]
MPPGILSATQGARLRMAHLGMPTAFACLVVAIGLVVARRYDLDHLPPQLQSEASAGASCASSAWPKSLTWAFVQGW